MKLKSVLKEESKPLSGRSEFESQLRQTLKQEVTVPMSNAQQQMRLSQSPEMTINNVSCHSGFCLFVVFCPTWIFHSYGDVTTADEGLQILTICSTRMAIEQLGFFRVQLTVTWGIRFKDPWNSHLFLSVWQWSWLYSYLFLQLKSNTQPSICIVNAPTHCATVTPLWLMNDEYRYCPSPEIVRSLYECRILKRDEKQQTKVKQNVRNKV